jgi:hypothetical protein
MKDKFNFNKDIEKLTFIPVADGNTGFQQVIINF